MATLKSVLHHFNKALKEYDTLHPETEVAQIVDLLPTINAAINGSSVTWDGKKFTNNALGITGLIDTNGYVAFGPNFGGLIIQWGSAGITNHFPNKQCIFALPISFSTTCHAAFATDTGSSVVTYGVGIQSKSELAIYSSVEATNWGVAFVLAVGK